MTNLSHDSGEATLFYGNAKPTLPTKVTPAPTATPKQQFLRLNLNHETVTLLPTKQLTEVLTVSTEQIAPMPHMSPWIVGTHNWRGSILWLVDLGYLLGQKPLYQQISSSTYIAAILQPGSSERKSRHEDSQAENLAIGLLVNQVSNIERFSIDSIQPVSLSATNTQLTKFLQGYWLKSESEVLAVLNPDSILEAISQPSDI